MTYREGETVYNIHVHNPQGVSRGVIQINLDGQLISNDYFDLLKDGGRHDVHVELGNQ
jgi:cyclic beta-1,2-glucan synthetase